MSFMESGSPQYKQSLSELIPYLNSSFFVITILWRNVYWNSFSLLSLHNFGTTLQEVTGASWQGWWWWWWWLMKGTFKFKYAYNFSIPVCSLYRITLCTSFITGACLLWLLLNHTTLLHVYPAYKVPVVICFPTLNRKASGPKMPSALVKNIFQHFSKAKVSKEALQAVENG